MNDTQREQLRLLLKAQYGMLYRVEQIWQALDAQDMMRAVNFLESFDEIASKAGNTVMSFMDEKDIDQVWKEISEEFNEPIKGIRLETFMRYKL